jgi:hypothetical protein
MHIWRLVAHHDEPDAAIGLMQQRSRIAIGWTAVGDLRKQGIRSQGEVTALIQAAYPGIDNAHLGGPSLWNFHREATPGDFVILTAKSRRVCVFEITGPYLYVGADEEIIGYAHQRAAVPTDIDPDDLWDRSGSAVARGQNSRWTMARCSEPASASGAILHEGLRYSIVSSVVERNPVARGKCIEHHGWACWACHFDFARAYGDIGKHYIHVHHRTDLATRDGEHVVDPVRDLVPLCPNCHAMVHRRSPSMSVEALAEIVAAQAAVRGDEG